jgi:hypothetical protein
MLEPLHTSRRALLSDDAQSVVFSVLHLIKNEEAKLTLITTSLWLCVAGSLVACVTGTLVYTIWVMNFQLE